jgi:hypothetical protein
VSRRGIVLPFTTEARRRAGRPEAEVTSR